MIPLKTDYTTFVIGNKSLHATRLIDITGKRFGKLIALYRDENHEGSGVKWVCQCDCGKIVSSLSQSIREGKTTSCGCVLESWRHSGFRCTHRLSSIPEYRIWKVMRQRCYLRTSKAFKYYGERGIMVCERWQKFENFIEDMGRRPSRRHSIDRIDNNGNYEPSNCRWATRSEQMKNRRYFELPGRRALDPCQIEEMRKLQVEGKLSTKALSLLFHVSIDTVRRWGR